MTFFLLLLLQEDQIHSGVEILELLFPDLGATRYSFQRGDDQRDRTTLTDLFSPLPLSFH